MSDSPTRPQPAFSLSTAWLPAIFLVGLTLGGLIYLHFRSDAAGGADQPSKPEPGANAGAPPRAEPKKDNPMNLNRDDDRIRAPELDGGVEWLNCAGPIHLKDLRGKIVLLDFWTYCCINCMHIMPDLAKLEKKYPNQLVVIGVHSPKFNTEKDSKNIREAILRYNIEHPVVNDANQKIWEAYGVTSWPTIGLIDPEGNIVGGISGEGHYELLDRAIEKLIEMHRGKKTLNEEPIRFDLAKFAERKDSPLYFPGKILADKAGKRLFIADSSHHRIVITDLEGKKLDVAGTGADGKADGPFEQATFNDPQGMALKGDILYVADRKNHLLRALDLKARTVKTIAGTGEQGHDRRMGGDPLKTGLNSPWDLLLIDNTLFVAMAGSHQIWKLDLKTDRLTPFAGNGREDIMDGTTGFSMFAQPSGLATDGNWLYVADSEVSAIRAVSLKQDGKVKTIVGSGLFRFGDVDGVGAKVRLQHPLAVAVHDGKVLVADTYNSKIKALDPTERSSTTLLGDGQHGKDDDPPRFDEPAGLSIIGDQLYIADTNNHSIRVADLKTKQVRTLKLEGIEPPTPPKIVSKPSFPNPSLARLPETAIPKEGELTLQVKLELPAGFKLNTLAPIQYLIETPAGSDPAYEKGGEIEKAQAEFELKLPAEKVAGAKSLKVSLAYFTCKEGSEGICKVKSQVWEIPLKIDAGSSQSVIQLTVPTVVKEDKK